MQQNFEMVAKTLQGLEEVLAEELRGLGASCVEPGLRMVSFQGDLEMLYKANLCCRTALRILKPFYKFYADSPDELYEVAKEFDWATILGPDKTFAVNTVANSEEFTHSRYATYRIKDAINDWFKDRYEDKRPRVSLVDPDIIINLHISGNRVTLSLDSSGESLHKRGYRVAQTEAPINEVLAAGIILLSGWRGATPFVDPMCGSGTFLIEAALIAANINPGIFRTHFAFEKWKDFNPECFDAVFNDDSKERDITVPIIGADISPKAIAVAERNLKSARLNNKVQLQLKSIEQWDEAPEAGVLVTNPPYGERLNPERLDQIYATLGQKLKYVFKGYHAWVIGYREEHFNKISLAPSKKIELLNGALECRLMEYIIFEGTKKDFRMKGGDIKAHLRNETPGRMQRKPSTFTPTRRSTPGQRFKKAFDDNERYASRTSGRADHAPQYPFKKERPKRPVDSLEKALNHQPTLPPDQKPIMRERKAGWKKRPAWLTGSKTTDDSEQQ